MTRPGTDEPVRAEILGVGTEILLGQIANTNARWISERLAEIGVDVLHHQVVGDNLERIVEALRLAASRTDVVIVTGGLGPTQDDVTRPALAGAAGVPLRRRPEIEERLRRRWASTDDICRPRTSCKQMCRREAPHRPGARHRSGARDGR